MKKATTYQSLKPEIWMLAMLLTASLLALTPLPGFGAAAEITDISISDAVADELLMDSAVPAHRIDVLSVDGIVTLSGSVDNILAKERAARIAGIVKGVRGVINEIQVNPSLLRTDWQVLEDVKDALLLDPATDTYEVEVQVDDHVVTLSGTVDSWQEKQLCAKVAKGVKGVKDLKNEIVVVWPEERTAEEIKAEVEGALEWDAIVDHALIDVKVEGDQVTLSGTVGSAAEKNWATVDAYVHGVQEVDASGLEVARWARDDDLREDKYTRKSKEAVVAAINDALALDPRVSTFEVTPEVMHDGATVILRGTVDNLKAKRAAAQDARNIVGVVSVDNRIKVRPVEWVSDEKIETRVRDALLRDPYVESYAINVVMKNGVANLYGTVDTYFEKTQAGDAAAKADGVIMVENNLTVLDDISPYTYDPYVDDAYIYSSDWYQNRPRFPTKSDWQIKADIEDELFWSPFVDADQVKVAVDNGDVTLTGTVDTWAEYNAAVNNAYEGGAVYVANDLNVKTP
ncbi:MAG: BON domain-containing protein [Desulfobacterales bacterium]